MIKSEVLCELLRAALSEERPLVYRDDSAEKVDSFVSQADVYSNDYKETTRRYCRCKCQITRHFETLCGFMALYNY